ncbi:MAG: patatin-like phospholipase family protein [Leptospiraceae bacterium]|nr:patatin-like phospholipase family protein [Leptospiraceae bacterium]
MGLALGSGAARGWVHVGIIRALAEAGIQADVVTGTSAGAVVGAFYAADKLDRLEEFAGELNSIRSTARYMDFSLSQPALIGGRSFVQFLEDYLGVRRFEELKKPFGVCATNLVDMNEVHIYEGALIPAIRASVAVPGFLAPLSAGEDRQLADGGMLNPIPVNLARKLGAEIVIGVDVNSHPQLKRFDSITTILNRSMEVMMNRIRINNRHFFPADLWLEPDLSDYGFFDLHRHQTAIDVGRRLVQERIDDIRRFRDHHFIASEKRVRIPDMLSRAREYFSFGANEDYSKLDAELENDSQSPADENEVD